MNRTVFLSDLTSHSYGSRTPSAPLRRLRAFFFLAQPPLLFQEGNTLSWQFIHTFYERHIANIRRGKFRTEENSYTSFPETSRCFSSNSAQRAYSASTAFSFPAPSPPAVPPQAAGSPSLVRSSLPTASNPQRPRIHQAHPTPAR